MSWRREGECGRWLWEARQSTYSRRESLTKIRLQTEEAESTYHKPADYDDRICHHFRGECLLKPVSHIPCRRKVNIWMLQRCCSRFVSHVCRLSCEGLSVPPNSRLLGLSLDVTRQTKGSTRFEITERRKFFPLKSRARLVEVDSGVLERAMGGALGVEILTCV